MSYELHETGIRRLTDNAFIPLSEGNRDYREYLEWVAAGNTPLTPEPPPPAVPQTVSRFQAKAALDGWQLLDEVEAMMVHPDTPRIAVLAWNTAQEFYRDSPTVAAMAQALGLTDGDLDALFIFAATIRV